MSGASEGFPVGELVQASRRRDLVNELAKHPELTDSRVLQVMGEVPRHLFVPPVQVDSAYKDIPLPIGHQQTISQPFMVACMTQELRPQPADRVLEIGTGSGYQAAVLSRLVGEVYTVELRLILQMRAAAVWEALGYGNIRHRVGDGSRGWPEKGPFDKIMVTAGCPKVPPPLFEQLRPGGILLAPVGPESDDLYLVRYARNSDGSIESRALVGCRFVPLVTDAE